MSKGWLTLWLFATALLALLNLSSSQPKRCETLCQRSEDSCQRCQLRIPMRFGKRKDTSQQYDGADDEGSEAGDDDMLRKKRFWNDFGVFRGSVIRRPYSSRSRTYSNRIFRDLPSAEDGWRETTDLRE